MQHPKQHEPDDHTPIRDHHDTTAERHLAATLAVQLWHGRDPADSDPDTAHQRSANRIYRWLTGAVTWHAHLGPRVDQATGQPTHHHQKGSSMKDTEKAELVITAEDARGFPTAVPADVTATSADTTIATVSDPDADNKRWVMPAGPGSTVVTVDWPDSPTGDQQGTVAVDVTTGDATSLQVSLGTPVPQ